MSLGARRWRALALLLVALACGALAAAEVRRAVDEVEGRVGAPVPVVVARADLAAGTRLRAGDVGQLLEVRQVPARFAPPDALSTPEEAAGLRTAGVVAAGSYVTLGALRLEQRRSPTAAPLRRGERAVEVAAVAGEDVAGPAGTGTRVDVVVTTDGRGGRRRSFVALENVELLRARRAATAAGAGVTPLSRVLATLRVSVADAVFLTAAQAFATEVRLLARPSRDRRLTGPSSVEGGRL